MRCLVGQAFCSGALVLLCLSLFFWQPISTAPGSPDYLQRGWQRLLEEGESCADCQPDECPPPRGCLSGVVIDHCDCCWECANLEGQICDLDNTNHFYGKCGENLECRLDLGDLWEGEVPEPQCTCVSNKAVCGSDGKTYPQICKFQEAANAHSGANLTVSHEGPCEAGEVLHSSTRCYYTK
ncbi:KAZD1 protein, partial [Polyodon spathula]|nr:KAZD1 protein [Polyodon spathula]